MATLFQPFSFIAYAQRFKCLKDALLNLKVENDKTLYLQTICLSIFLLFASNIKIKSLKLLQESVNFEHFLEKI
jgi:hypothetical protein